MRYRVITLLIVSIVAMSAGCATPRLLIEAENARTNTHVVLAFEETVFNKHRVREGFARYVAPEYVEHDPMLPQDLDADVKALSNLLSNVFPDSNLMVKRTVAQRDLVAVQSFWYQMPGQTRVVARFDLYRLVNTKIVEHWKVEQTLAEGSGADERTF